MTRKSVAGLPPLPGEPMSPVGPLSHAAPALGCGAALVLIAVLGGCSGGGAATPVNPVTTPPNSTDNAYTGPAPGNADVQAFKINLWENIRAADRCGGCHHQGGQSPMFARSDDVNLAYQAAGPLVNLVRPDQSTLVLKVGSGHNCWVADPSACAATLLVWIQAWIGAGSASTTSVQLVAPPVQAAGGGKQFPADPTAGNPSFQTTVYPLLTKFCSGCHTSSSSTAQQPYFASSNINEAYAAAQPKMNLASPNQSRFYVRLADEFHHCWVTPSSGGAPDCPGSSAAMLAAISAFANGIPVTPIDPNLVISNALTLKQGTVAAGGNRYEANLVAKYMFQTGTGSTAYDTSGVTPAADLSLSGNVTWVGGWGIDIGMGGKAQASTSTSAKLAAMIQSSGEYSIEAWVAPANVAQTSAYIVSYSGSNATRDATLGQDAMQYEGRARSSTTETTGQRQWQGVIKFVAIHNRALTQAQIQQNFAVGVGEKYYLLFGVSALTGVSQSYILFQATQYDTYGYLFSQPKFISLDPQAAAPSNLQISGMRLGVNGVLAPAGQAYSTLSVSVGGSAYTAANGQLLSTLGGVVPATLGPANDLFFLSFDQLGTHVHAYLEPTVVVSPPAPDNTPQPDFGVATFERINHSLSRITGVPVTNSVVSTVYNDGQQ